MPKLSERSVMALIMKYLKMRVMVRFETRITSHELENEGRRYIEREKDKTVNPSTVSRKWRLLKYEADDPMLNQAIGCDEPYVVVKELQAQTHSREGVWEIVNIMGVSTVDMLSSGKSQLTLFEEESSAENSEEHGG